MRIHLFNGVGESFKPIYAEDEHIVQAALFEFVQDRELELRTLLLLFADPHSQNFFKPLEVDGDGEVDGLCFHDPLDPQLDEAAQARKVLL